MARGGLRRSLVRQPAERNLNRNLSLRSIVEERSHELVTNSDTISDDCSELEDLLQCTDSIAKALSGHSVPLSLDDSSDTGFTFATKSLDSKTLDLSEDSDSIFLPSLASINYGSVVTESTFNYDAESIDNGDSFSCDSSIASSYLESSVPTSVIEGFNDVVIRSTQPVRPEGAAETKEILTPVLPRTLDIYNPDSHNGRWTTAGSDKGKQDVLGVPERTKPRRSLEEESLEEVLTKALPARRGDDPPLLLRWDSPRLSGLLKNGAPPRATVSPELPLPSTFRRVKSGELPLPSTLRRKDSQSRVMPSEEGEATPRPSLQKVSSRDEMPCAPRRQTSSRHLDC